MNKHTQTPGQMLAAAREAHSLSQADIAKQMRLSVETINDIEHDEYSKIAVRTFVRGYLSTYARIVDVSQTQLIELFDSLAVMTEVVVPIGHPIVEGAPVLDVTRDRSRMRYSPKAVAGLGGGLLILLFFVWHASKTPETASETVKNDGKAPTALSLPPSSTTRASIPTATPVATTPAAALPLPLPAAPPAHAPAAGMSVLPAKINVPAATDAAPPATDAVTASAEPVKKPVKAKRRVWHHNPNQPDTKSLRPTYTVVPVS